MAGGGTDSDDPAVAESLFEVYERSDELERS